MSESVIVALIAGPVSAVLMLVLTTALGRRKVDAEIDATLSARWEAWSGEQDRRIERLENRVKQLESDLTTATEKNRAQASLMSSLIGWALQLRDEVLKLGGHPPAAPPEVQAALTSLDAPL